MMFEDEYVDVDSEIKVRRPAPSDDAPHWMRPVPVCKVDNAESHALSSTTSDARPWGSNPDQLGAVGRGRMMGFLRAYSQPTAGTASLSPSMHLPHPPVVAAEGHSLAKRVDEGHGLGAVGRGADLYKLSRHSAPGYNAVRGAAHNADDSVVGDNAVFATMIADRRVGKRGVKAK